MLDYDYRDDGIVFDCSPLPFPDALVSLANVQGYRELFF